MVHGNYERRPRPFAHWIPVATPPAIITAATALEVPAVRGIAMLAPTESMIVRIAAPQEMAVEPISVTKEDD